MVQTEALVMADTPVYVEEQAEEQVVQLRAELAACNAAILSAIKQPDSVSITGGVSYTGKKLTELYTIRDRIRRELRGLCVGNGGMVRMTPEYS